MVSSKQGEMRRVAGTQGGGDVLDDTSQEKVLSSSFSLMSSVSAEEGNQCRTDSSTGGKDCRQGL